MTTRIRDLPLDEQPRERLARHGVGTLSDAELLSVVLSSTPRTTNTLDIARAALADGLAALTRRDWRAYAEITGIGEANASRMAAAFELGRRATSATLPFNEPVCGASTIARSLLPRYAHHVQERLGAVYLDAKHRVMREREIYIGTLNSAIVSTRDVMLAALHEHAAALIVFHNHPSGDPAPSADDLLFTRKLVDAGKALGVDVLDHLILGAGRYMSLKERGMM